MLLKKVTFHFLTN